MEPKGCQSEPRDVPKDLRGNRVEKLRKKGTKLDFLFGNKSMKIQSNKSSKKLLRKNMVSISKWYQNGAEFDVQTHQQTCNVIVKTLVFEGRTGCVCKQNSFQKPSIHIPKHISKSIEN